MPSILDSISSLDPEDRGYVEVSPFTLIMTVISDGVIHLEGKIFKIENDI